MLKLIQSAKLNKEIKKSLLELIECYYLAGKRCDDSYTDFYGHTTEYCNTLKALTDDNVFDKLDWEFFVSRNVDLKWF